MREFFEFIFWVNASLPNHHYSGVSRKLENWKTGKKNESQEGIILLLRGRLGTGLGN